MLLWTRFLFKLKLVDLKPPLVTLQPPVVTLQVLSINELASGQSWAVRLLRSPVRVYTIRDSMFNRGGGGALAHPFQPPDLPVPLTLAPPPHFGGRHPNKT